ncbi:MAG: hypothetical protein GXP49_07455 [Deltaproteobacteria bacterium]|nr:hypothetical protein [Deltaproteobacteria bacterium]
MALKPAIKIRGFNTRCDLSWLTSKPFRWRCLFSAAYLFRGTRFFRMVIINLGREKPPPIKLSQLQKQLLGLLVMDLSAYA